MALDSGPAYYNAAPPPQDVALSGYPVQVTYARPEFHQQFWAIPVIGILVKAIILIPHWIVLYILQLAVRCSLLILWIPVLLGGRYPLWGYALVGGTIRWTMRVQAYLLGLTDEYPPFTFRSATEDFREYQVQVRMEYPPHHSRLWAFPVLGLLVKLIDLIPHLVVLSVLSAVVYAVALVLWVPVLFNRHYPDWGYQMVGGTIRWSTRVLAFLDGLTDRYPPFSFD